MRRAFKLGKIVVSVKLLRTLIKERFTEMVEYPAMLPLEAAQLCIEIVKERKISERKVEFAKAAWNVQGYAQKMLLGDQLPTAEPMSLEIEGKLAELAACLSDAEDDGMLFSAESEEEAGSVVVIFTIIGVVVQVLSALGLFDRDKDVEETEE